MVGRSGISVPVPEFEECRTERVSAPQGHGGPYHGEVKGGQGNSPVEVMVGNIGHAGATGVGGQPEVKSSRYLIGLQVGDRMVRVVGHGALGHPSSDLVLVRLAVNTGEFGECVGPELGGVGPGDPFVLVDPHNRGDIADGVQLGKTMVGVDQNRVGDTFCQFGERFGVLVNGRRDDREPGFA